MTFSQTLISTFVQNSSPLPFWLEVVCVGWPAWMVFVIVRGLKEGY